MGTAPLPEDIDWARFGDEYDEYTWVPDAIAAIRSGDKKASRAAIKKLDQELVHQGGMFLPASAAAMPFLLQEIEAGNDEVERLIPLVTEMALGGHHNHFDGGWGPDSPLASAAGEPEVRRLFVESIDRIAAHLDGKAALRAPVLLALAFVPERAADHLPLVLEQVGERSKPVRFGARLAAGLLARALEDPDAIWPMVDGSLGAKAAEDRWAAAMAWAWASPKALDEPRVRGALVEAVGAKTDKKLLWGDGRVTMLASQVLVGAVRRDGRRDMATELLEAVEGTAGEMGLSGALVRLYFDGAPKPEGTLRRWDEMDETQQWLIGRYARRNRINTVSVEAIPGSALSHVGLPTLKADLRRLAGVEKPAALEQVVDGRPLWWHLFETREDPLRRPALVEALRAGGIDVIALAEDAITGVYRLSTRLPAVKAGDRIYDLAILLAHLIVELVEPEAALAWVRFVGKGERDIRNDGWLKGWNRAYLAMAVAHELGALAELDREIRDPIVATADQLFAAPGAREYLEAATAGFGD